MRIPARSRLYIVPSFAGLAKEEGQADLSRHSALRDGGMPTRERFLLRQAYGGTSRPNKCLVVKSLDSSLRSFTLRNMESTAITTRQFRAGIERHFRVSM